MKTVDKLIQEFDMQFNPGDIQGFRYDSLTMIISEFSDLYQIKKHILLNSLLKS
jgi:hypothetical protein